VIEGFPLWSVLPFGLSISFENWFASLPKDEKRALAACGQFALQVGLPTMAALALAALFILPK